MFYCAGNNDAILPGAWWWILAPGLCVAILGAGLAFINFGIDEIANPRLRKERSPNALNLVITIGTQINGVLYTHQPKMGPDSRKQRAIELLRLVDIAPDRIRSYPHELSV